MIYFNENLQGALASPSELQMESIFSSCEQENIYDVVTDLHMEVNGDHLSTEASFSFGLSCS